MSETSTIVLVTGGALRLGQAITEHLARRGCAVAIHYHASADEAKRLEARLRDAGHSARAFGADLGEPDARRRLVAEVVEAFGRLDGLVNNAALFERIAFSEIRPEQLERMWRVNAEAPFHLIQLALPWLRSVVNLTDIAASRPFPVHAHYCMSKAALESLTRSLAAELAPAVRVNAVAPGAILFPGHYDEAKKAAVLHRVPQGRPGTPEEIAEAVEFLLLGPSYVTGQILAVDGGRSARL